MSMGSREAWTDHLSERELDEMEDAGRIGRPAPPPGPPEYAAHIANRDMKLLILERVGKEWNNCDVALLTLPGPAPRPYYSGVLFMDEGVQVVAGVNEYASETEARWNAESQVADR